MSRRTLDWTHPVNLLSPLNRGVTMWLSGRSAAHTGGRTWFDLCRRFDGTFYSTEFWDNTVFNNSRSAASFSLSTILTQACI